MSNSTEHLGLDPLLSPFHEMCSNLGKKLTTLLKNSVGSRDAQQEATLKPDLERLLCTNMLMRESYFWDVLKILDLI